MTTANDFRVIRVLDSLLTDRWCITPDAHKSRTETFKATALSQPQAHPVMEQRRPYAVMGDVAVIPVEGVLYRKFSDNLYERAYDVTSTDVLQRTINVAADDDEVSAILMAFDSPGGVVSGIREAAQCVRYASEKKPVVSYADGQMCSAAYWLASQSTQVYAMPSASVGSIGVYLALLDVSRAAEMAGIRVELFKSGKFKGAGQPGTSLSDDSRAMLQAGVDKIGAQFRAAVNAGRGRIIDPAVMQGQSFDADECMANGLIDGVCDFDAALSDAAWLGKQTKKARK